MEYNCNIYIAIGDYVRLSIDHSAIVIGKSGNTLTLAESDFSGPCKILWGRTCDAGKVSKFCHASNYDQIASATIEPERLSGTELTGPFIRTIADGDYHIVTQ